MSECYKEEWKGRCCCNCKYRLDVMKHPWNSGESKGRIIELFGYVCNSPDLENGIFFDKDHNHGLCEVHEFKDDLNSYQVVNGIKLYDNDDIQ